MCTHRDPVTILCDAFGIRLLRPDTDLLWECAAAFARLPYENLTKLIKKHRFPPGPARRRSPSEVIEDHLQYGTGGTCFSLNNLFAEVLHRLGFPCFPVLCDMRAGADSHCALVVTLGNQPYLLDPAYLIRQPLPLPLGDQQDKQTDTTGNVVVTATGAASYDLATYNRWRYSIKLDPVPRQRYTALWDSSFDWTMMNGIHLSATAATGYAYVHNHKLCLRVPEDRRTINIRGSEASTLTARFGIDATIVDEAYRLRAALVQQLRGESP